jgi:hypothetical protein
MNKCKNCTDKDTELCSVCGNIKFNDKLNSEYTIDEIIKLYEDVFTEDELNKIRSNYGK